MIISAAKTKAEIEAIQALRYLVNMQELGKEFLFKDDANSDLKSMLLYAERNDAVIGSLRCKFIFENKGIRDYWAIQKPNFKSKVALVDRLVIHPTYRKTRVAYDLTTSIYKQALLEGCHIALIETEAHLVGMYEKVGFQVYREVTHDYGHRFQMFINPWDSEYLRNIKSPFHEQYTAYIQMVNAFTSQSVVRSVA